MKPNELQHYGVKGMRWKHTRGSVKKASDKPSRGGGFSKAPRGSGFSQYHPGQPVPGQPNLVYVDTKGGVMTKKGYEEWKKNESDPLYGAKETIKDLPENLVDAGKDVLDTFFGVKKDSPLKRMSRKG